MGCMDTRNKSTCHCFGIICWGILWLLSICARVDALCFASLSDFNGTRFFRSMPVSKSFERLFQAIENAREFRLNEELCSTIVGSSILASTVSIFSFAIGMVFIRNNVRHSSNFRHHSFKKRFRGVDLGLVLSKVGAIAAIVVFIIGTSASWIGRSSMQKRLTFRQLKPNGSKFDKTDIESMLKTAKVDDPSEPSRSGSDDRGPPSTRAVFHHPTFRHRYVKRFFRVRIPQFSKRTMPRSTMRFSRRIL